ncbi:putative aminomutase [Serratia symbiotica str. 'Cinara cedri']|nr:putative aminomutase [Serratia symbiotica str. 'Cinara cedri']
MASFVAQNTAYKEDWLHQLANVITNPNELLHLLSLDMHPELLQEHDASRLFALRVPRVFVARMRPGDVNDPLLRQVISTKEEFIASPGFVIDPLDEQCTILPGLLHKYRNRALLLVKGGCAVNCRYCFRRYFPYHDHHGNKSNWRQAITYIRQHSELDEIIFSGGDPLMAKDHELSWLIDELATIPHLKRLRIHTRLPVVIPARITPGLCKLLSVSRLQVLMVTHINHANEIDSELQAAMVHLRLSGVTLLNQSVLMRRINDNADTLAALSNALFDIGILPYYIHMLDKVEGAAHFMVSDDEARAIMQDMLSKVSGYLVPRLVREVGNKSSKMPLDLHLISNCR